MDRRTIIEVIRRTAAENGGRPHGRLRLEAETGIKRYDWMKYWPRFGQAQREAGFEPNEAPEAYGEDELIRRLVALACELGRFPTEGDRRVKAHADPTFPSLRTFNNRLGTKPAMMNKVAAYCSTHSEFSDVLQWCSTGSSESLEYEKPATTNDGFVYLVKSGRYYKIGKTNSVGRRERELAIQLPEQAKTVHYIKTDDPTGIEAYWHKRFEAKRKNGEWFDLSAQDVAAFRRRKFM
jgi:hypothetical protein